MNKLLMLTGIVLSGFFLQSADKSPRVAPIPVIGVANNAPHILRISNDTVFMVTGNTISYTVDTPDGQGLVSTNITTDKLPSELKALGGAVKFSVTGKNDSLKSSGYVTDGDHLLVISPTGKLIRTFHIVTIKGALKGNFSLEREQLTVNTPSSLTLFYTAGQRSPAATIKIQFPKGINISLDNVTVNVIGRGDVLLRKLQEQSVGRTGDRYSYKKVGEASITQNKDGGQTLTLSRLDLRPPNAPDLKVVIRNVDLKQAGNYTFRASYTTSAPEVLTSPGTGSEQVTLQAVNRISDFERVIDKSLRYKETSDTYTKALFKWSAAAGASIQLQQSLDSGLTWKPAIATINKPGSVANIQNLLPNRLYAFRLSVKGGQHQGLSNIAWYYTGKLDIKKFNVHPDGTEDNTDKINTAIAYLNKLGGGILLFSKGTYLVRTVHLKSNVYLYVDKEASIKAIKGNDAPETTWFSDRKYRSGLSPTDMGPYADPENYLTKEDVGHHYFHNAMFFGERLDNIKIIGSGRITGDGNLVNGDRVMNNSADNRADKMFALKQCTNVEIGGIPRTEDLWYDSVKDEPYYIGRNHSKIGTENMLNIDKAGHFVLLATGTDNINMHDDYMGKQSVSNCRDIFDFMASSNVTVTNIYSKASSDDIIKLGSDCSLGFTRKAFNYKVRNVIGDTNCNLLQIGSETADDITDVYVDNIYILGANKAGFSISANDGAHISNIRLNSGYTGKLHSQSQFYRCTTPFFISISNRGRVIGADAGRYSFVEDGKKHDELLVKNINIGEVENISLNHVKVYEVYSGSSYSGKRWRPFDGTQKRATPIIAGYKLPDAANVKGGLDFKLPNGKHTGYVKNIVFNDIDVLVKGGNPVTDTAAVPPELGVGQYNVGDLKVQPAYGLWARHVNELTVENCSFNYEKQDNRYAIFLDDVMDAHLTGVKVVQPEGNVSLVAVKNSARIKTSNVTYYQNSWGSKLFQLPDKSILSAAYSAFPNKR
jgi:polygalacturonase